MQPPVGHEADGDLLLREEARVRVVQHHDVEAPVGALVLVASVIGAQMLFLFFVAIISGFEPEREPQLKYDAHT